MMRVALVSVNNAWYNNTKNCVVVGFEFGIAMYTSELAPPGNLRIHSPIADKDGNALVTVFKLCADTRCNGYNELLLCSRDAEI